MGINLYSYWLSYVRASPVYTVCSGSFGRRTRTRVGAGQEVSGHSLCQGSFGWMAGAGWAWPGVIYGGAARAAFWGMAEVDIGQGLGVSLAGQLDYLGHILTHAIKRERYTQNGGVSPPPFLFGRCSGVHVMISFMYWLGAL